MIHRYSHLSFLIISALLANYNVIAAEDLSVNETAMLLLTQSPAYSLEKYSLAGEINNLNTVSNLPDPELGGEFLVAPVREDNRWAVELSWGLEWPGVYGARRKESKGRIEVAEKALNQNRLQRFAEIKDLLLDYIQCRKKLKLLERLILNNDTIYKLAEDAAKGGELTVLDLNKVRLEYANIKVAQASLLDDQEGIVAELSRIYGKDCNDLLGAMVCEFPEIIIPSDDINIIRENSAGVTVARMEAQAARQARNVAKMEALPSFSIGYKHAYEEGMNFNGPTLGISIPIFSSRGKRKAADSDIVAAEFRMETAGLEAETEYVQTSKRLRMLATQIYEISPLVEDADYNATLLKAYKGGVLTLIEYITERNYFTNAAIELVGLKHAAAKAQTRLEKLKQIDFQFK